MNTIETIETKETKETKDKYTFLINNEIYDLTNFVPLHPGGADMFNCLKPGSNITSMIYSYHKDPKKVLDILPKYKTESSNSKSLNLLQSNVVYTYDNYLELKKLVYDEMHEQKIPFFWSTGEIIWNAFMFVIYVSSYIYLFYNAATISAFRIFIFSMFVLIY